jgi:hypothetical protein
MKSFLKTASLISLTSLIFAGSFLAKAAEAAILYKVSQETAANNNNFAFRGYINPYIDTSKTISQYYSYNKNNNVSFNGVLPSLANDRSHLFLVKAKDGLSLVSVHNILANSGDRSGGSAQMKFSLSGDPNGASFVVKDDPSDTYTINATGTVLTTNQSWSANRTDGFAIGSLNKKWTMLAQFTDFNTRDNIQSFSGLNSWAVYSKGSASPTLLALGKDRRVKIEAIEIPESGTVSGLFAIACLGGLSALKNTRKN